HTSSGWSVSRGSHSSSRESKSCSPCRADARSVCWSTRATSPTSRLATYPVRSPASSRTTCSTPVRSRSRSSGSSGPPTTHADPMTSVLLPVPGRREERPSTRRGKSYFIRSLGCQMSEQDSERITGLFKRDGKDRGEDRDGTDGVHINTCTIEEYLDNRNYGIR